jgi:hypothetical protein
MKRSSNQCKPFFRLGDFDHQLNMYALAASAAGVGVLALSQPAEAKIVYTKTHRVIEVGQHYNLDLNNDKVTDLVLSNVSTCTTEEHSVCWGTAGENAAPGNGAAGYRAADGVIFASAMKAGDRIGVSRRFYRSAALAGIFPGGGTGPWYKAGTRYLGVMFLIKGKTHYGWARLKVTGNFGTTKMTLTGYAYETIPNKPIIAGKTRGPDVITVQPGGLGRLARGWAGLTAGRPAESANGVR